MSLLDEVREGALNSTADLTTTLRKGWLLATHLKQDSFREWVASELNGYKEGSNLPPYRIRSVQSRADIAFGQSILRGAPVSVDLIPDDEVRRWAKNERFSKPISEFLSLSHLASESQPFQMQWPQVIAVKYGAIGRNSEAQCLSAWKEISPVAFVGIVDSVRNKLLEFVLEAGAARPDLVVGLPVSGQVQPVQPAGTSQQVNHFHGPVGNISQQGHNVRQSASIEVSS